MPRLFFVIFLYAVLSPMVHACLWDRDTVGDEIASSTDTFDVLTGQFAHHGDAYYEYRLQSGAGDVHDKAVAYIRLGQYEKGDALLLEHLKSNPDDYYTLSNLGVSKKKQGKYLEAEQYIERALSIRPEGHMGIGDWYLEMITWRKESERLGDLTSRNFLRETYDTEGRFKGYHKIYGISRDEIGSDKWNARFDRLVLLLKNDQTFSDGFLLLGDMLIEQQDYNMAYIAYHRAATLEHPKVELIQERKENISYHSQGDVLTDKEAEALLMKSEQWLESFFKTEAVQIHRDGSSSFESVLEELDDQNIEKYHPDAPFDWTWIIVIAVLGLLILLCYLFVRFLWSIIKFGRSLANNRVR